MKYWNNFLNLIAICLLSLVTACYTTNPDTGEREFDEVKTESVKIAFETFGTEVLRQVIVDQHKQGNTNIITYLRYTAETLTELSGENVIDPDVIIRRLNAAIEAEGVLDGVPSEAISAKNLAVALYRSFYNQRHRAELDPEKFAANALDVLARTIEQSVHDAVIELGLPPVVWDD